MRRGNLVLASDSPALHTDQYELGNLQGALRSGVASRLAVFELFARRLPEGRRYGVFAGLGRLLDRLENFRFTAEQLRWLNETQVADAGTRGRLEGQRFTGDVWAYQEGDLYFPNSPLLTVVAPFAEAVLLETICLSICNWDSGIASSASRMVTAARGLPITEMGTRRTHEEAAIDAARAAYIAGFSATSNMEAGYRYGIPVTGTAAHCFTMAHRDELTAFRAQVASQGPETTLLVDTYDLQQGIRNAVAAAGPELGGVRIDSGDLLSELPKARQLLDSLGARQARIVLTGGLDEYAMDELSLGAAGGFGSGERLIAHPSPGFVYKLVAIADSDDPEEPLRRVSKRSASKLSLGGRKWAYRRFDASRFITAEDLLVSDSAPESPPAGLPLQERVVGEGRILLRRSVEEARAFHQQAKCRLRPEQLSIQAGPPAILARPSEESP
ncbi:MAG: nicotinate phosphoribosyltransferase [Candidatus Dormibacter sp.]|uniref:nicotinate phosphoribosyltransferase n=1 Tax=Candidatus Dormibacter sp. TaxID=2973982 RepID=UPI000DB4511D|nr:MAG: nicotinate phosphoribosyltransferase [Candidatus Dormibacteraeota bacterium]